MNNDDSFYRDGLNFECQQCSSCCRHETGHVYLSTLEIDSIISFLKIERSEFIQKYCKRVNAFNSLRISLIEKSNFDCIFWNKEIKGCKIYSVRPTQCRTYPFWPSILQSKNIWDECAKGCPGINKGKIRDYDEIVKKKKEYERDVYGIDS